MTKLHYDFTDTAERNGSEPKDNSHYILIAGIVFLITFCLSIFVIMSLQDVATIIN